MGPGGVVAAAQASPRIPARPNTALEATGHSVGFLVCGGSVRCGPRLSLGVRLKFH